ncbi:MAG TPA: hypothetical protein VD948_06460, partial [Rhodothermales bacterium]|nr:hypothetical protein [Rhodothermales bacterium]
MPSALRRLPPMAWAYGALCLGLWPLPVLQVLHVESAALVAAMGFFGAGQAAIGALRRGEAGRRILQRELGLLLVPWGLLTASLLWAPNRDYARGLALFATFTGPSVALGVTLAYALARRGVQRVRTWHVGLGLTVALGSALFDLGLHPQFYHYSHVWGGMLGPIYDEDLAVRPGLFAFRGVTLLWAALCVAVGRRHLRATGLVLLALGGAYAFRGSLGFNTLPATLHRALGPPLRTPHFDLYGEGLTPQETEYRYAWLAARLSTWPRQRVEVFIYPDVATKRRLTGAGHTSVAPVWLATPQVHLVREAVEAHFGHELVHAFSREFGLPILKASRH